MFIGYTLRKINRNISPKKMAMSQEVPFMKYQSVYAENQHEVQQCNSSCDAYISLFINLNMEMEVCFFQGTVQARFNPALRSWIVSHTGSIELPPSSPPMEQRMIRAQCDFMNPSTSASIIYGYCRVPAAPQHSMSVLTYQATRLVIHVANGNILSYFLTFPAMNQDHPVYQNPAGPVFQSAAIPPMVNMTSFNSRFDKESTNHELVGPLNMENNNATPPPPLSLYLSREFFPDELKKDAWRILESNGSILEERLVRDPQGSDLVPLVVQCIVEQALFLRMLRTQSMRPSVRALVQAAQTQNILTPLATSLDIVSLASSTTEADLFDFVIISLCQSPEVIKTVAGALAPAVCQRIRDAPFAVSLKKFLGLVNILPSDIRTMLVDIMQSPIYLRQAACNFHASEVLLVALTPENPELVADAVRTFGFGRKRLVLAVGTDENGSKVLATVIKASSPDNIPPLFDFRDALNESVKRLAVHPNGSKVAKECIVHPFFRDSTILRLFDQDLHDMVHRTFPLLLEGIKTEQKPSNREDLVKLLQRRSWLLGSKEKTRLESMLGGSL